MGSSAGGVGRAVCVALLFTTSGALAGGAGLDAGACETSITMRLGVAARAGALVSASEGCAESGCVSVAAGAAADVVSVVKAGSGVTTGEAGAAAGDGTAATGAELVLCRRVYPRYAAAARAAA